MIFEKMYNTTVNIYKAAFLVLTTARKLFSGMTSEGKLQGRVRTWVFLSHMHKAAGDSPLSRVHNSNKCSAGVRCWGVQPAEAGRNVSSVCMMHSDEVRYLLFFSGWETHIFMTSLRSAWFKFPAKMIMPSGWAISCLLITCSFSSASWALACGGMYTAIIVIVVNYPGRKNKL